MNLFNNDKIKKILKVTQFLLTIGALIYIFYFIKIKLPEISNISFSKFSALFIMLSFVFLFIAYIINYISFYYLSCALEKRKLNYKKMFGLYFISFTSKFIPGKFTNYMHKGILLIQIGMSKKNIMLALLYENIFSIIPGLCLASFFYLISFYNLKIIIILFLIIFLVFFFIIRIPYIKRTINLSEKKVFVCFCFYLVCWIFFVFNQYFLFCSFENYKNITSLKFIFLWFYAVPFSELAGYISVLPMGIGTMDLSLSFFLSKLFSMQNIFALLISFRIQRLIIDAFFIIFSSIKFFK